MRPVKPACSMSRLGRLPSPRRRWVVVAMPRRKMVTGDRSSFDSMSGPPCNLGSARTRKVLEGIEACRIAVVDSCLSGFEKLSWRTK